MTKGTILPAIIMGLVLLVVGINGLGFFDWMETTDYGWIITDQSNPYVDSGVYHNSDPQGKVNWWLKIMSDPETRWYTVGGEDEVYKWGDISKLYTTYENGFITKDTLELTLLDAARLGTFDNNRGSNVKSVGTSIIPTTMLDEEGMKIQQEKGCVACHPNK